MSLTANKHPSEAMELVWSNNAKEETGEISFINAATVLSVVKEYGKYTGTILEKPPRNILCIRQPIISVSSFQTLAFTT